MDHCSLSRAIVTTISFIFLYDLLHYIMCLFQFIFVFFHFYCNIHAMINDVLLLGGCFFMANLLPWLIMSNYSLDDKSFPSQNIDVQFSVWNCSYPDCWCRRGKLSLQRIPPLQVGRASIGPAILIGEWWPLKHWLVAVECCLSLLVVWFFFVPKWQYEACNSNWWSLTETLKLNCLWFESLLLL